ncbi:MAG: hypothetical protein A3G47_02330 [Candidatus Zambryskibacteria bacterium RIFCSPLOWO2_12_FULL_39_45]|uniref:Uncharacterized protein n=1 Tax=Candidatus Zambryskibacteria bacterium RIFCSPHIGHO2_02_38_10.5 TaxID=1802742 RepID=A0A1G2T9Z4_9BACT|nr:MAG: hypothetical protein A2W58_01215 [Candidatus Zambryskibacteria bacterium RIFCSPHIGHO2_02_38_10.5]OHB07590.1 MAG: hypothetical protein A2W64_02530 [Candidatus Zambryskibacteria bacterium RIFCSPLOWO2_02_39_10]OHB10401.1 MAG: hypothetical protein A3I21_01610 [Candidatus Zambryskibacteria bacterium RIFCSPLOWO2_02_FULL_39_69]OHB13889.1 MAG: hypothetical protein A3G47_02330 [Candidatus Zambryskibacteria bacterium RIFCSPLOWO2_12_FULL_39_45]
MTREEIRNKIFEHFKGQIEWAKKNPNQAQQFQMGQILSLFPNTQNVPHWELMKVHSVAREIVQELINAGYVYPGTAQDQNSDLPWLTVTQYGMEAFLAEDWLPYDPEGYVRAFKAKVPTIDDITLAYIGEAVAGYNRRHLLSATITLGVASENLMLLLIEAYTDWIPDATRQASFQKKVADRFISIQYKEFKKEFLNDVKSLPKEFQSDWETYLDGVFNFVRLNRNDAGHPTGRQFDAKVVYANLQVFAEYAQFIFGLIKHSNSS